MNQLNGLLELIKLSDIDEVNKLIKFKDSVISYKVLDVYHTGFPEIVSVFIVGKFEDPFKKLIKETGGDPDELLSNFIEGSRREP